jgi:ABC-type oligopeptide transport system substrate-binding subunit
MQVKSFKWAGAMLLALVLIAAGATSAATGSAKRAQVLRIAIGAEPPSLDPGLATDTTSANVLLNVMDPLVRLGPAPALKPRPAAASSWNVRGATVTLHLNKRERWTNGKPVTAADYVWAWLRTISPELGADYAYQFYGIKGAEAYNSCDPSKTNCNALRSKVGFKAKGKYTLVIQLKSPQSWFIQQLNHHSFLPVYRPAVTKFGNHWTDPSHIVTDGPFKLQSWNHDANLTLVKNKRFYNARKVKLSKIVMSIISDGATAVNAFEAGNVDVNSTGWPPADAPRIKRQPTYHRWQALGTYYYGINVKNIPDVNQRRAMAYAIDRNSIINNIAQGGQAPARGLTPVGISGGPTILRKSKLPANGNISQAKAFMAKVKNPNKNIHLYFNNSPAHVNIAVAVQSMWKPLGLDVTLSRLEWKQYLQFLGPPPNKDVDVYRLGWIADFPDAYNFLALFTCNSGNNSTNWCNKTFDNTVAKAGRTQSVQKRVALYQKAESIMTSPTGDMPIAPIYWYTFQAQVKTYVRGYTVNPMDETFYDKVSLK